MANETNLKDVTRLEIIGKNGREYVDTSCQNVRLLLQDDGRTLKVFFEHRPTP